MTLQTLKCTFFTTFYLQMQLNKLEAKTRETARSWPMLLAALVNYFKGKQKWPYKPLKLPSSALLLKVLTGMNICPCLLSTHAHTWQFACLSNFDQVTWFMSPTFKIKSRNTFKIISLFLKSLKTFHIDFFSRLECKSGLAKNKQPYKM